MAAVVAVVADATKDPKPTALRRVVLLTVL
jgi:hypothetical protein